MPEPESARNDALDDSFDLTPDVRRLDRQGAAIGPSL
jgi:hypothetical protein